MLRWTAWAYGSAGLVAVLAAAVLVACGSPPPLAADPCPASSDGEAFPSEYTDRAAPYTGPSPHHFVLVTGIRDINIDLADEEYDGKLPTKAQLDSGDMEAQLIVCEYLDWTGDSEDTCEYIGAKVALVRTSWAYRVFEARTSKPVGEFNLNGTSWCPASMKYWGDDVPTSTPQLAADRELMNALQPFLGR